MMCFNEDGPEFMSERMVRGRKAHRCIECFEGIPPGVQHEHVRGMWDGSFSEFRTCQRCLAVRAEIVKREIAHGCERWEATPPYGGIGEYLAYAEEPTSIASIAQTIGWVTP